MSLGKAELHTRVFGVACHICVEDIDNQGNALISLAQAELQRLEQKFSAFHSSSVIGQINRRAGSSEYVPLDSESRSLFEFVNALWHQSNHQFDPSTAVLENCYANHAPVKNSKSLLAERLPLVGWSKLELNTDGALLQNKGMLVNLDSCVRPYAVDSIRRIFLKQGVGGALISLKDDIATIGKQPDGANWLVGVKYPKGSGVAITRLKLNDSGYAIRGNFEHCLKITGERFGNSLSPVDGHPTLGLLSVGVMADTCLEACGAASVAQVKTEQAALKWLEKLGYPWIAIDRQLQCHGLLASSQTS
jgi:thiamine biosynthesis lipoprotein